MRQTVHYRRKHGSQIGLGIQVPAKLNQCAAIVIALAIENPVEPFLDPALHGIEQKCGDHYRRDQTPLSGIR